MKAAALIALTSAVCAHAQKLQCTNEAKELKLQILHSSDEESNYVDIETGEIKILNYAAIASGLRAIAEGEGYSSLHLLGGDSTLPNIFYQASAQVPEYGAVGISDYLIFNAMDVKALGPGNLDFSSGLNTDLDDISAHANKTDTAAFPIISSNLDFSGPVKAGVDYTLAESGISWYRAAGKMVPSTVVTVDGACIGIVSHQPDAFFVEGGAYAADLAFVGGEDEFLNPVQDQYAVVQAEVDALLALGVNKIILLDHHEGYLDCASEDGSNAVCDTPVPVTGVDIIVSAEEANQSGIPNPPFNTFFDEDYEADYDYPVVRKDANGDDVYVVGVGYSGGLYKQVGNLMATFDAKGKVVSFDERSGPVSTKKDSLQGISSLLGDVISTSSVSPGLVDGLIQPPAGVKEVWDRIEKTALIQESLTIVGETTNLLQDVGSSTPGVFEANLGRLAAESSLWFARQQYPDLAVDVALKNSGGIRANIAAGPVTRFSIAGALAFNNLLSIVEIDGAQLLAAMENSVAGGSSGGAFGFIDGAKVTYDLSKDPVTQVATLDKPSRVVGLVVTRADGTEVELVNNGKAVKDALSQTFVLATNSFLTNGGGDGYFSLDRLTVATELAETPVGEQEILELYITDFLGGMIDYPNPTPAERANYIEA